MIDCQVVVVLVSFLADEINARTSPRSQTTVDATQVRIIKQQPAGSAAHRVQLPNPSRCGPVQVRHLLSLLPATDHPRCLTSSWAAMFLSSCPGCRQYKSTWDRRSIDSEAIIEVFCWSCVCYRSLTNCWYLLGRHQRWTVTYLLRSCLPAQRHISAYVQVRKMSRLLSVSK